MKLSHMFMLHTSLEIYLEAHKSLNFTRKLLLQIIVCFYLSSLLYKLFVCFLGLHLINEQWTLVNYLT